jgi:hypothetical protein
MTYDTRTYFDKDNVERWYDDDTVVNQNTVFRQAYNGAKIDVAKMARAARNSAGTSRAVSREAAAGNPRGTLRGISRKSEANLKVGIPDVYAAKPNLTDVKENPGTAYGRAVSGPAPNWATVKKADVA